MTETIGAGSREFAPRKNRFAFHSTTLLWPALTASLGLLTWLRLPAMTQQTVWAEDGGIFLRDVLAHGGLWSIPMPYDGYLHVIPRALVSVAYGLVPLQNFAIAVSVLTCTAVAAIAAAAFLLSRWISASVPVRAMIAVVPILLPVGPKEVLGNAANLHWYLLWLMPWLLLYRPQSRGAKVMLFVTSLAVAASEIITGIFLPLVIWSVLRRRSYSAPAGWALGICLQVIATLVAARVDDGVNSEAMDGRSVLMGFALFPIASNWYPDSRTLASTIVAFGGWALVIPCVVVAAAMAYTLIAGTVKLKVAALGAFGASLTCWVASVMVSSKSMFSYAQYTAADWETGFGYMRYAAAPAMFLLLLLPLAASTALERKHLNCSSSFAVAGLFVVFLLTSFFPVTTARQLGPSWSAGVNNARAICIAEPDSGHAGVPTAPTGWKYAEIHVDCRLLTRP